jgi:uncharacterized membrane protein YidH (DUF202 family)
LILSIMIHSRTLPRLCQTRNQGFIILRRTTFSSSCNTSNSIFRPITVKNSGSIARDILAAERTFLAWARTGLGFVGAGSALFGAYHDRPTPQAEIVPACLVLLLNGTFLLGFATRRYLNVVEAIQKGSFPVLVGGTLMAVAITAIGTLASLGLVARAEQKTHGMNILKDDRESN